MIRPSIHRKLLTFLGCCCWVIFGHSQDFTVNIRQFDLQDGLIHRRVNTILEDKEGFVWLGMPNGLQRFDGRNFKTWSPKNGAAEVYEVTQMYLDNAGWIWIWNNTLRKFAFVNTLTEEVATEKSRFPDGFPKEEMVRLWVYDQHQHFPCHDSQGRLYWMGQAPQRLIRYDASEGFVSMPLKISPQDTLLGAVLIDTQNHIWGIGKQGHSLIFELDTQGHVLQRVELRQTNHIAPVGIRGRHLVFRLFTPQGTELAELDLEAGAMRQLIPEQEPNVWFIDPFAWKLEAEGWKLQAVGNDDASAMFIPRDAWKVSLFSGNSTFFQDRQKRVWIINDWGMSRVEIRLNRFQLFPFIPQDGSAITVAARGLLQSGDQLVAVLEGEGLAKAPLHNPNAWTWLEKKQTEDDLYGGAPLLQLRDGNYLIGGRSLHKVNPEGKSIPLSSSQAALPTNQNWALYEDAQGNVWAGTMGAVLKISPEGRVLRIPLLPSALEGNWVYAIVPSPDEQSLWLGTAEGLFHLDMASGMLRATHCPASTVYSLHIDRDTAFWMGTPAGLVEWHPKTNAHRIFTTQDGLASDVVYCVLEDAFGCLWLSSDDGLMRFDKQTRRVQTFREADGILFHEFNRISAYQAADGRMFFGGLKGVTSFDPRDFLQASSQPASLQITDFEIFDGDAKQLLNKTGNLRATKRIVLQPNDGYFRLRFAIPNTGNEDQVLYAWRLMGKSEEWAMQKEDLIQLAGLPYGDFNLQLKGLDQHGNWTAALEISISVERPFYLRTGFLIFLGLLAVAAVVAIFLRRNHLLRQRQLQLEAEIEKATEKIRQDKQVIAEQAEELKSLDLAKSRFFANVTHEFRTPLTLIQGPIGTLLKWPDMPEAQRRLLILAHQNTQSLLKLVGSVLDLGKLESGKMLLVEKPVSLFGFMRRITASFESLFAHSGRIYLFHYAAEESLQVLLDEEKVETILKNLISNAAKFTTDGEEVRIEVTDLENQICITVSDTGRGILPADLPFIFDRFYQTSLVNAAIEGGTGIGLALSREFAHLMKGTLTVTSEWGKGSAFTLGIPRKEVMGVPVIVADERVEGDEFTLDRPTTPTNAGDSKRKSLMIVEDNPALREYLGLILSKDYRLYTAENGRKAIDQLTTLGEQELPDLILSDIMMPEMDGYQLLERLKTNPLWWRLPVIMLTARADLQDKLRALRIGVDDYLLKPFESEELTTRISNLLRHAADRALPSETAEVVESLPPLGEADQKWLEKLELFVAARLNDPNLSIAGLAVEFAMSESTFLRQVKRLTGLTPVGYLSEHKLQRARQLLENGTYRNVADVAYEVGFEDAKAFSRSFKSRYGKPPSDFLR